MIKWGKRSVEPTRSVIGRGWYIVERMEGCSSVRWWCGDRWSSSIAKAARFDTLCGAKLGIKEAAETA